MIINCTSFCTGARRSRPFDPSIWRGNQPLTSLFPFHNDISTVVFTGREFRDGINEIKNLISAVNRRVLYAICFHIDVLCLCSD